MSRISDFISQQLLKTANVFILGSQASIPRIDIPDEEPVYIMFIRIVREGFNGQWEIAQFRKDKEQGLLILHREISIKGVSGKGKSIDFDIEITAVNSNTSVIYHLPVSEEFRGHVERGYKVTLEENSLVIKLH